MPRITPKTKEKDVFTREGAIKIAKNLNIDFEQFNVDDFLEGLNIELEHKDVTHGDPIATGKIALSHLKENPKYYKKLKKHVENKDYSLITIYDSYPIQGKKATIMRDGIYLYLAKEIGDNTVDPMSPLKIYRPKEEVEKAYKRLKELGKIPACADHPKNFFNLQDKKSFIDGFAKNPILKNIDNSELNSSIEIICDLDLSGKSKKYYDEGITELSCGWDGEYVKAENEEYDYIQKFIDINHVALVKQGRCGDICTIKDKKGDLTMDKEELKKLITDTVNDTITDTVTKILDEKEAEEKKKEEEAEAAAKKANKEKENEFSDEQELTKEEMENVEKMNDRYTKLKDKYMKLKLSKGHTKDSLAVWDKKVEDTKKKVKDELVKRMTDIFPVIENNILKIDEISGKTPCEIKAMTISKVLDRKVELTDLKVIDTLFDMALKTYINPAWKGKTNAGKNIEDVRTKSIEAFEKVSKGEKLGGN